jgi:hypothetical protein
MALARAHAGEHDELDAVGLHGAVAERAHDLVIAAGDGNRSSARRALSLSMIAMVASIAISPNSFVGSKFSVKSVVK